MRRVGLCPSVYPCLSALICSSPSPFDHRTQSDYLCIHQNNMHAYHAALSVVRQTWLHCASPQGPKTADLFLRLPAGPTQEALRWALEGPLVEARVSLSSLRGIYCCHISLALKLLTA